MSSKFMSHSSTSGSGMDQTADSGSGMDMVPGSGSRTDILACSGSILVSGLDFGSVAGMGSSTGSVAGMLRNWRVSWDWFGHSGVDILIDGDGGSIMGEYSVHIQAKCFSTTISGQACSHHCSRRCGPDLRSPGFSPQWSDPPIREGGTMLLLDASISVGSSVTAYCSKGE